VRTRRFVAANMVMLACFAGTVAGAAPAAAADPVVVSSCTAVVDGEPGQQILLSPESVADPVSGALATVDPLGLLAGPFRDAWKAMGPIPVGTVPDGEAEITGPQIAGAVDQRLTEIPLLAPVLTPLTKTVSDALGALCGILARGAWPSTPPASTSPAAPAGPGSPGSPSAGGWSGGQLVDSAGTSGGSGAVFGERLSGLLPSGAFFGLNTSGLPQSGVLVGTQPGTQPAALVNSDSAGSAQELPATARDALSLPALLAALMLAIVGAQLVRRWVLHTQR
jgi:hypothetical protein